MCSRSFDPSHHMPSPGCQISSCLTHLNLHSLVGLLQGTWPLWSTVVLVSKSGMSYSVRRRSHMISPTFSIPLSPTPGSTGSFAEPESQLLPSMDKTNGATRVNNEISHVKMWNMHIPPPHSKQQPGWGTIQKERWPIWKLSEKARMEWEGGGGVPASWYLLREWEWTL